MIRKLFFRLKGKLYVIPTLYGFAFFLLSIALIILDNLDYVLLKDLWPSLFLNLGKRGFGIFTLVSSSLITMVTITFSIMMVVLTIYGTQLSSRSLQDFLSRKTTLRVLGYYIGALIFSLIQLAFGNEIEKGYGLGALVSIILLIVGIGVLGFFIHYISKSIQINIYIDNIVKETVLLIEKSKKHVYSSVYIQGGKVEDYDKELIGYFFYIHSTKSGYVQYYDTKKLLELAIRYDIRIKCDSLIGDYILPSEKLAKIFCKNECINKEEIANEIFKTIIIGDEPDLFRDISTGSKRLVDVAIKSLSSSINDPATAISCIQNIGYLLNEIAKGLEANVYLDESQEVRVVIRSLSFNRLLFNHFYQIKHYGSKDLFVLEAIMNALIKIAKKSSQEIRNQVWEFAKYLIEDIDFVNYHQIEKKVLAEKFYQLSQAARANYEFGNWDFKKI